MTDGEKMVWATAYVAAFNEACPRGCGISESAWQTHHAMVQDAVGSAIERATLHGRGYAGVRRMTAITWHADPPTWAPYVSDVMVADRGTEVHLSIDMRCKRVPAYATMTDDGVRITFYAGPRDECNDEPDNRCWPDDLGPWREDFIPSMVVMLGERVEGMEVVGCDAGRYTVEVTMTRKVDWETEGVSITATKAASQQASAGVLMTHQEKTLATRVTGTFMASEMLKHVRDRYVPAAEAWRATSMADLAATKAEQSAALDAVLLSHRVLLTTHKLVDMLALPPAAGEACERHRDHKAMPTTP